MKSAQGMCLFGKDLNDIICSDMLHPLREIATYIPELQHMGIPVQFRVVIDANIVFSELKWLTKERKKPTARTSLQELIDAGTLQVFAPTWLDQEMLEHAEEFAAKIGVSVDRYLQAWEEYRGIVSLVQPKNNELNSEIDPDDTPYVSVYEEFGAHAVYSNDHHISRMGAFTINSEVIVTLKNYSRAASWQYTIQYGGIVAIIVSWQVLVVSLQMLVGIAKFIRSLPVWTKALLLACGIALIAHPSSRSWLIKTARRIGGPLQSATVKTGRIAIRLGAEAIIKTEQAHEALSEVKGCFDNRRVPLRVLVIALCATEQRPFSLDEIERKVLANGYQTRAKDFRSYLRRKLRESKELVQTSDGWIYRSITEIANEE
ncbi:MAG: hypothetical protein JXM79_14485 [Sedimentisphaerales bacterium]|nr:hypothetical protein [Sedimentisphaerales bacterium]